MARPPEAAIRYRHRRTCNRADTKPRHKNARTAHAHRCEPLLKQRPIQWDGVWQADFKMHVFPIVLTICNTRSTFNTSRNFIRKINIMCHRELPGRHRILFAQFFLRYSQRLIMPIMDQTFAARPIFRTIFGGVVTNQNRNQIIIILFCTPSIQCE